MTADDEATWTPQGPTERLSEGHCWELLGGGMFGRLAVSVENKPLIFPVNYGVQGRAIVFRTVHGTKLADLMENAHVAFETDERDHGTARSVVVTGEAEILADPWEIDAAERLGLPDWIPTDRYVWVSIRPTTVTGRMLHRHVEVSRLPNE